MLPSEITYASTDNMFAKNQNHKMNVEPEESKFVNKIFWKQANNHQQFDTNWQLMKRLVRTNTTLEVLGSRVLLNSLSLHVAVNGPLAKLGKERYWPPCFTMPWLRIVPLWYDGPKRSLWVLGWILPFTTNIEIQSPLASICQQITDNDANSDDDCDDYDNDYDYFVLWIEEHRKYFTVNDNRK